MTRDDRPDLMTATTDFRLVEKRSELVPGFAAGGSDMYPGTKGENAV